MATYLSISGATFGRRDSKNPSRPRRQTMLAPALDAFSVGIVVCDAAGRVIFANASARERIRDGARGPLRLRGRHLIAATPEETRTLKRLIRDAASGNHWGAMGLSGHDAEETVPILLSPLIQVGAQRNEYILLAIGESRHSPWITEATLGKLYRLSRTQGSIAIAIFNGQSPEDIASERGIKISTVRTHLADIFLRTRTRTQRDLIRLIGSLPPLAR